ncbi:MAG TPA: MFS transporter [Dehalococcoidia bacterium]|nr:MFS transporter [Dehalococcoidia bacterium]
MPRIFFYTLLPAAFVILGDSLIYLILPLHPEEFGVTDYWGIKAGLWIGIALSVNRFIRIFTNSLASKFYLKFGFKIPFIIAIFIGSLTTISYGINNQIIILIIARIFWGASFSFTKLGTQLAAFEFGSDNRARFLGFANSAIRAGSLLSVILGVFLIQITNISTTFFIFGVAGLIVMFITILIPNFLIQSPLNEKLEVKRQSNRKKGFLLAFITGINSEKIGMEKVKIKLLSAFFLRFSSGLISNGLVIATISLFISEILVKDPVLLIFQINVITLSGIVIGIRWFADLFLSVILGEIADKKGTQLVVNICVFLMILSCGLLIFSNSNLELMFISFTLLFCFSVGANVSLESISGYLAGQSNRSITLSRFNTFADLGSALGPLIAFILLGFVGFQIIYIVSFSILLFSWIIFLTIFVKNSD